MGDTQWDDILTTCIQKNWKRLTKAENIKIKERRMALNRDFFLSEANILKLRNVNDILHQKEKAIHAHAKKVRAFQKQCIRDQDIDDFEIDFVISLWNDEFDNLHPDFEGNAFLKDMLINFGNGEAAADSAFEDDNWNEFMPYHTHALSKEFHCYTFHHLYDHTYLAWQDIAAIQSIWIEIHVDNQFLISIVKSR